VLRHKGFKIRYTSVCSHVTVCVCVFVYKVRGTWNNFYNS